MSCQPFRHTRQPQTHLKVGLLERYITLPVTVTGLALAGSVTVTVTQRARSTLRVTLNTQGLMTVTQPPARSGGSGHTTLMLRRDQWLL